MQLSARPGVENPEREAWTSFAKILLTSNELFYVD